MAPNHPVPQVLFIHPSVYADPARGALAENVAAHAEAASGLKRTDRHPADHLLLSGTAAYQAAKRYGSVSYTEQFTGPQATLAAVRRRGPAALSAFVEGLAVAD